LQRKAIARRAIHASRRAAIIAATRHRNSVTTDATAAMIPATAAGRDALEHWTSMREPEPDEPAPVRKLDTAPIDWSAMIDKELLAEREFILSIVREAICDQLERARRTARRELAAEIRSLKLEVAKLATTIAELRSAGAGENARVIDLPARGVN
jgi:hypothetical protein